MIIKMQQIPKLKRLVRPSDTNAVIVRQQKRPIKVLGREAVAVEDAPHFVERRSALSGLLFLFDCVLDKAVRIHSHPNRKDVNAAFVQLESREI